MDIQNLFEAGVSRGLFTDFDVCVEGAYKANFSGGYYISRGARLFDVSSLTKACTHLLLMKLFSQGDMSPEDSFKRYLNVPQIEGDDRQLWHFLSYVAQSYSFDYESLRDGTTKEFKQELLTKGFGHWSPRFKYDNIASAYLAIALEKVVGTGLETILRSYLLTEESERQNFHFHPVHRGLVKPELVIPTRPNLSLRGRVHDTLSFHHEESAISVAGLFTNAQTLGQVFHREVDRAIKSNFYQVASRDQLTRVDPSHSYGLGFDIPFSESLKGFSVEEPLLFAGWTGCRVFFCKKPRLTICFLTNRTLPEETGESRKRFSDFSWNVIRKALHCAH